MTPELHLDEKANIFSPGFWVASSIERCQQCREYTPCFTFLLPSGNKELDLEIDENEPLEWITHSHEYFLKDVWSLSTTAIERMQISTKSYYVDSTSDTTRPYWANHCQNCNAILDESLMFGEPGGGFSPESFEQAKETIKLHWHSAPFWAYSFGSSSGDWVEWLISG